MKRTATALIALLAVFALASAAGSFGGVDQPTLTGDAPSVERGGPRYPPEPQSESTGNESSNQINDGSSGESGAIRDGDGSVSPLFVAAFLGVLVLSALALVMLTDDDHRAPSPATDDEARSSTADAGSPVDPTYGTPADNAVIRAWKRLRDRLAADESATPGELAGAAADRGLPGDPVQTITREFEAVRYGREPVDERRASRVTDALSRIERGSTVSDERPPPDDESKGDTDD